jgi:hypothetical protein
MLYDTWSPYDPVEIDSPEDKARQREKLERQREAIRAMLPRLRQEIENPERDTERVYQALRPYHETLQGLPMTPDDLPEIEALCRLVLEWGGLGQNDIQRALLWLVGTTAAVESVPFLLDMLHHTRRGDHFGPERRQLALWGLARVAIFHDVPEAYAALREGLDDRRAEVRITTADLILNAYLDRLSAHSEVPQDVVDKLCQMARSDPDDDVRRVVRRHLREPWARSHNANEVTYDE